MENTIPISEEFWKKQEIFDCNYLFIIAKSSKKNIVNEILRNAQDKRNIISTKIT